MWKIRSLSQKLPICILARRPQLSVLQSLLLKSSLTTSQQEFSQANQLASIEEELAQVQKIAETFEVESGLPVCVMGNQRANIEFWKSIGALYFMLSIIENGYKLPFACSPEPVKLRNNKSARLNADFLNLAICDNVLSGRICVVVQFKNS